MQGSVTGAGTNIIVLSFTPFHPSFAPQYLVKSDVRRLRSGVLDTARAGPMVHSVHLSILLVRKCRSSEPVSRVCHMAGVATGL